MHNYAPNLNAYSIRLALIILYTLHSPLTIQETEYNDSSSGSGHYPVKQFRDLLPSLLLQLLQHIYLYQPCTVMVSILYSIVCAFISTSHAIHMDDEQWNLQDNGHVGIRHNVIVPFREVVFSMMT